MKLATLAWFAALCFIAPATQAAPGEPLKAGPAATGTAPAEAPPHPGAPAPESATAQSTPRPAASARAERRRRSYAACNRASHQRGLRGGRRRRFLIRCRLGYERTRLPAAQPAAGQPPQPGRKP